MRLVEYEWRYDAACKDQWEYVPIKHRSSSEPLDGPGDLLAVKSDHIIDAFFPPRDKTLYAEAADYAKTFCLGENGNPPCPVRLDCLWDAISREEPHGIWGGLSHRERNAIVRKWKRSYSKRMTLKQYVFSLGGKYGKD